MYCLLSMRSRVQRYLCISSLSHSLSRISLNLFRSFTPEGFGFTSPTDSLLLSVLTFSRTEKSGEAGGTSLLGCLENVWVDSLELIDSLLDEASSMLYTPGFLGIGIIIFSSSSSSAPINCLMDLMFCFPESFIY